MIECLICGSRELFQRSFSLKGITGDPSDDLGKRRLISCGKCGYERNSDIENIQDAIRLQNHFDGQSFAVDSRQLRWPSRSFLVSKKINRLAPKGGCALDVGCNVGLNLKTLGSKWSRFGVELSKPLARIASKFVPATIYDIPIESLSVPDESFDLITAYAVIEHLYDPAVLVKKMHELLKPGGFVVIMTGDVESSIARKMGAAWPLYVSPDHVSFFSARALRLLLIKNGFQIICEDWRNAYFQDGLNKLWRKLLIKLCEVMGVLPKAYFDHYYIYAKK